MRAARLIVVAGVAVAAGALHLKHLWVDGGAFAAVGGGAMPTIWQELGPGFRTGAVLLVAALLAVGFRREGGAWDLAGAAAGMVPAGAALAGAILAWQSAAEDAAVVGAALDQLPGTASSAAGWGFWVLLGGCALVTGGMLWDLAAAWRGRRVPTGKAGRSVVEEDATAVE